MVIIISAFASGLVCYIIGFSIGFCDGIDIGRKEGYNQRSDEGRMRRGE